MKSFNVIHYDFNSKKFKPYDVIPYFVRQYQGRVSTCDELKTELDKATNETQVNLYQDCLKYWKVPVTFEEFKEFVRKESFYQFWSRCEYEIILVDWPCQKVEDKWDIHDQIMMNLDVITQLVIDSV